MLVHLDWEYYSPVDIKTAPLDVYAYHPEARIVLGGYAFDEGPLKMWEPDYGKCPELKDALCDDRNQIVCWNCGFERTVLAAKGLYFAVSRFIDVMVHARYVGLPGRLKDCVKVPMLGIPAEEKTKSESALIKRFCTPNKEGKRTLPSEAPEDWELFKAYCAKDVLSTRHIKNWLEPRFPFPESERQLWLLDQVINERGIPVDVSMAQWGEKETARIVGESFRRMQSVTGLENSNSVQQLHPWLTERGYKYNSLSKEFVKQALEDDITAEAREILTLRLGAAKSSVKKFSVISQMASPEAA